MKEDYQIERMCKCQGRLKASSKHPFCDFLIWNRSVSIHVPNDKLIVQSILTLHVVHNTGLFNCCLSSHIHAEGLYLIPTANQVCRLMPCPRHRATYSDPLLRHLAHSLHLYLRPPPWYGDWWEWSVQVWGAGTFWCQLPRAMPILPYTLCTLVYWAPTLVAGHKEHGMPIVGIFQVNVPGAHSPRPLRVLHKQCDTTQLNQAFKRCKKSFCR